MAITGDTSAGPSAVIVAGAIRTTAIDLNRNGQMKAGGESLPFSCVVHANKMRDIFRCTVCCGMPRRCDERGHDGWPSPFSLVDWLGGDRLDGDRLGGRVIRDAAWLWRKSVGLTK